MGIVIILVSICGFLKMMYIWGEVFFVIKCVYFLSVLRLVFSRGGIFLEFLVLDKKFILERFGICRGCL